jgi:hypothetical protein
MTISRSQIQIIVFATCLAACGTNTGNGPEVAVKGPVTQEQIDSIVSKYAFIYEAPILPDSGSHALLPMSIQEEGRGSKVGLSSSYEYEGSYTPRFWNILFMDRRTHETHLLTDQKLRIDAIHIHSREQGMVLSKNVLYTIIDTDVDRDGKLDYNDPSHLSISALDGSALRPISPVEEDLIGWDVVKGEEQIVVRTRLDNDGNGKHENHEDIRVYVYDVVNGKLKPVISNELQKKVNTLFFEQWLKKVE